MIGRLNILYITPIAIIVCYLLPIVKVGSSTHLKPDMFFMMILLPAVIVLWNTIKQLPLAKQFLGIAIIIFFLSILSNSFGSHYYLSTNGIVVSFKYNLIFSKILFFLFFLYVGAFQILKTETFIKIVSIVFLGAMIFGVFQYFEIGGAKELGIKYYVIAGVQETAFTNQGRIIGTAPGIISWGGCNILMFFFFFFLVKNKLIKGIGASLAILNILAAASRSAIIALALAFFIIQALEAILIKRRLTSLFKVILITIVLFSITILLFKTYQPERFDFLLMRFDAAEEAMTTSGRGAQLSRFFSILNTDPLNYFLGIGQIIIEETGYMEIDSAYILISFGILGFIAHYLLLYLLVKCAYDLRMGNESLFLFVLASTIGYLIFSIGFFFLYDVYMGLPFWWLNGFIIGSMYMQKLKIAVN